MKEFYNIIMKIAIVPENMKVLIFREQYFVVAQCLNYDICAQGDSVEEAKDSFLRVFISQCFLYKKYEHRMPGKAPQYLWDAWEDESDFSRELWGEQVDVEFIDKWVPTKAELESIEITE